MTYRRKILAKIHIAKKYLAMSDEEYRFMLEERYGVRSAVLLGPTDLAELCRHFEKLGFRPRPPEGRPSASPAREALLGKVFALCYVMRLPVPEYAAGMARKMYGVHDLHWCTPDQLSGIIAALVYYQKRRSE